MVLDLSPLARLMLAPSKQAVDDFFCACAREHRGCTSISSPRVTELMNIFGLTEKQAYSMQLAGIGLIRKAVFNIGTHDPIEELFPDDFQPQLKGLIMQVLQHHMEEWRCAMCLMNQRIQRASPL